MSTVVDVAVAASSRSATPSRARGVRGRRRCDDHRSGRAGAAVDVAGHHRAWSTPAPLDSLSCPGALTRSGVVIVIDPSIITATCGPNQSVKPGAAYRRSTGDRGLYVAGNRRRTRSLYWQRSKAVSCRRFAVMSANRFDRGRKPEAPRTFLNSAQCRFESDWGQRELVLVKAFCALAGCS